MDKKREIWVDDVKVIACVLVVLGHFFQSVPYLIFSFATWILKTIFVSSTNDQIGGLFEILFLKPTSPYWYLYCLFFLFLITPTFRNTKMIVVGFVVAFSMKIMVLSDGDISAYAILVVLQNEIWFVMGMCLSIGITSCRWKPVKVWISTGLGIVFVVLSILLMDISNGWISFLLGVLACVVVIELVRKADIDRTENYGKTDGKIKSNVVFAFLSKYTMPIFVMHTLFAAPFRVMLLKIEIENSAVHMVCGITISFIGPIVTAEIMKKMKVLEIFLYPEKFVKV